MDLIYDRRREGFDPLTAFHLAVPRWHRSAAGAKAGGR